MFLLLVFMSFHFNCMSFHFDDPRSSMYNPMSVKRILNAKGTAFTWLLFTREQLYFIPPVPSSTSACSKPFVEIKILRYIIGEMLTRGTRHPTRTTGKENGEPALTRRLLRSESFLPRRFVSRWVQIFSHPNSFQPVQRSHWPVRHLLFKTSWLVSWLLPDCLLEPFPHGVSDLRRCACNPDSQRTLSASAQFQESQSCRTLRINWGYPML